MSTPFVKVGTIGVLLILLFLVLNFPPLNKEIKNFFYLISKPLQKFFWKIGDNLADFLEVLSNLEKLKKENELLKIQNQELLAKLVILKEIKKENEILRKALNLGLEKEFKFQIAHIISKEISEDSILIDKGIKDGISKGLPVITPKKALVGQISEVYKNFSKVRLISNKKSTFLAKVVDKEISGKAEGKGKGEILFSFIPQENEAKKGDILITTSLGGIYPRGLLVGLIKEVKKSDLKSWQEAEIKPFFDLGQSNILFLITQW